MPPAMAPLTGTTASRSSGGSGESDSSVGNISGQDSGSAAPPDDGESSMVPRRDAAAGRARGSAPCLREGAEESAAAGVDAAHLLPRRPLPAARAPQPTCSRRAGPRPGGGSSVPRPRVGPGSGAGPSRGKGDEEGPGRGGSPASPLAAAFLNAGRRLSRPEWARAGDGAGPAGLGWGRRRQGPPPLTGSRRRRLRGSEGPLPQPEGAGGPGFSPPPTPSPSASTSGMSRPAPLTLRSRLWLRLALRRGSHKPGSRGGGGGRRHPREIGRSNRGPSARPRVQSSNEAEEELPPKAGKIGRRIIHLASPASLPNPLSWTALQCVLPVRGAAAKGGGGVGRRGGRGVREI